jgi:phosphate transport system protein
VRHLDEMLEELRTKLLRMSGLAQFAIVNSVQAVTDENPSLSERVFRNEAQINQLEIDVDALATTLLALEQPVAVDLRFITAATRINSNLERIGDLAVNIAERANALINAPDTMVNVDIPQLAGLAGDMVQKSLDAFVKKDSAEARSVLFSDNAVDDLRDAIFDDLIRCMKTDSKSVNRCVDLMFVARSLERIADHATNIAECVLYMVEGVDVRHHHQQTIS